MLWVRRVLPIMLASHHSNFEEVGGVILDFAFLYCQD